MKLNFYKVVSIITAALFVFLFYQLFFCADAFCQNLGLEPSVATSVLSRRTSMFMLGLSVLLFSSRNLPPSKARNYICLSTGVTMVGLACMGSYELWMGRVNTSILSAIAIEIPLGMSFLLLLFKNRKVEISD